MPFLIPSFNSRKKTIKTLTELFNRTAGAPLGQAAGKESFSWIDLRGSWTTQTDKAQTSSAANTYPLSMLPLESSTATITAKGVTNGTGIAFWVTDSNNWYATVSDAYRTCQTCSTCNAYTTNISGYYAVLNYNSWNQIYCNGNPRSSCPYNCGNYRSCSTCSYGYYGPGNIAYVIDQCITNYSTTCSTYTYYDCNCTDNYAMRIIKSLAGTVTTVATSTYASAVAAIKSVLSGNSVTSTAYSDSNATVSLGDLSQTIPDATINSNIGIVASQISDTKNFMTQGNSISSITTS